MQDVKKNHANPYFYKGDCLLGNEGLLNVKLFLGVNIQFSTFFHTSWNHIISVDLFSNFQLHFYLQLSPAFSTSFLEENIIIRDDIFSFVVLNCSM